METRLLNLSSYDINASDTLADYYNKTVSTPFGTVSDNRWSLTWNNIDLSKVVGDDFYNRFNLFRITLVSYNLLLAPTSAISTPVTAQHYQDSTVNWFLQGLPFYPPVYNSANGAILNTGYVPLNPSTPSYNMTSGLSWTFTKVKTTNISVNMRCMATGAPYNPGSDSTYLWGHSTLTFQITGVPDIIFPTPLPITYGTTLLSSLNASIISGISGEIEYYLDSAKTVQAFSSVVLNAGTSTLYADFVPTNSFYSGSSQSASLLVNVASTSTLFTTPTAITYGQTPSFSSTGSMPGTFSYFTDSSFVNLITESTVFNAGTYTIYSRLVPTSTNYAPSFDSKQLVVNKASTFLTFPNITSILYGVTTGSTALASLLTGTYANISGGVYTFHLDNASGQVITTSTLLSAGTYTIYCEYTSENDNYSSCTGSTTIAIQAHPTSATFSVSTPASIVYGTDLTSILNATADIVEGSTVAGTVSYYKNAAYTQSVIVSDILPVGNYTIYAVFQPANTTNYLSSVVTTFLTVTQRPTVITTSPQTVVYKSDVTTALTASVLTDLGGSVEGTTSFYYNSGYTDLFSTSANIVNYRYYKFTPTKLRSTNASMVQFSELNLRFNGTRVDYSTAVASNPDGSSNSVSSGIDNSVTTKFSDTQKKSYVIDFGKSTKVSDYTFATANDMDDRDPLSWILYGSNDNSNWVVLDTQNNYPTPTTRNTYLSYFAIDAVRVGTYTVYVRFIPLRANFAISTASYSLTVTQKPSVITFPSIVDASYNATLSSFITSTTADVMGTFAFSDTNSNVLTSTSVFSTLGQYPITASFTPVDTNYAVATATYSNLYVRYKPTFSFTTATSSITYGNSLSGQLVTSTPTFSGVSIPGTTTFRLDGTVVDNSTNLVPRTTAYPIIATFVPTDPTRYYTITTSNTKNITVGKRLFYPTIGDISGYLLDTPPTRNVIFNLTFQDTSSNSMSFSSASIYYYEVNSSYSYPVVSALPKVSDTYIYTTPFTGNSKTYNQYVELNNFSSDKYVQAFNKYNMTINKRPILFSFNIPESLKTISYGTPITANHLCATVTDKLTNTVLANKQSTYTFSATDLSQNVITNSVLNSGTYHLFANFVDASNIYLSGNTFSTRSNTLTVTKVKSTLTTPNISSIVYGTTMDGFITGTTKNVAGSLRFYKPQ